MISGRRVVQLRHVSALAHRTRISQLHTMHRLSHRYSHLTRLSGIIRQTQSTHHKTVWPRQATLTTSGGAILNSYRLNSTQANKLTLDSTEELTDSAITQTQQWGLQTSEQLDTPAEQILEPVKEIPFAELGLGGYSPIGLLQHCLEGLHMSVGLPWWGAIAVGTIIVRLAMFPVVIKQQRHAANMNNHMPRFQELTKKMNAARTSNDQYEMVKCSSELQVYMKKHDVNPLKSFMGILVQAPVFISFFIGLRRMAELPVESMTVGGMMWFKDLTITDPYYALPVLASLSMLTIIQMGGEAGISNPQAEKMKRIMKFLPLVILPFIIHLPQAVFMYWLTNNTISAIQVSLLKFPAVRTFLKIPGRVKHDPADLPKGEGFIKELKKGWKNSVSAQDIMQQKQAHINKLKEAGTGPVPQTFAYDPTRPAPHAQHLSTQRKDIRQKIR